MTQPLSALCKSCGERPVTQPRSDECRRCYLRRWRADNPGYVTAATRKYRSDPEKAERDRERSRRWKREHLGQPGLPKNRAA